MSNRWDNRHPGGKKHGRKWKGGNVPWHKSGKSARRWLYGLWLSKTQDKD